MPVCALTGEMGPFVKAHLIPRALSYPSPKGQPLYQVGNGSRPTKRWTSWYDEALVTASGEKILADLDDWLIRFLRQHKLVWSGWQDGLQRLPNTYFDAGPDENWRGVRIVDCGEPDLLGRAILSIVWRTGASSIPDMVDVQFKHSMKRRIRSMVLGKTPVDFNLIPITFVQITTKGEIHNHTPVRMRRVLEHGNPQSAEILRYYFDGLVIHAFPFKKRFSPQNFGGLMLNGSGKIGVVGVSYETSFQKEILDDAVMLSMARHPNAKPFRG